jgi:hypothetical protein
MWRTRWMSIFGVAVLVLTMLWTPAFAQTTATPAPTFGEWIELKPGDHVVLPFKYAEQSGSGATDCDHVCRPQEGHHVEKDCMKNCTAEVHLNHLSFQPFKVELFTEDGKAKPVSFNMLTPDDMVKYVQTGKHDGFGAGAKNTNLKSQLSWEGYLLSSGTDYVIVSSDYNAPAPIKVKLVLSGAGVSS